MHPTVAILHCEAQHRLQPALQMVILACAATPEICCRLHWVEGLTVSAAIVGAALGSALGGLLSDRIGRKLALLAADCLFTTGALCMAFATSATALISGEP